jgi:hypothetical protein
LGKPDNLDLENLRLSYHSVDIDGPITKDELDFNLKARLRDSTPEERYRHRKREWYFHKLSYLHQTVNEDGEAKDIINDYGCGHPSTKREEGGCCVPECRFYAREGRIEDEEIVQEHTDYEEQLRRDNKIMEPPDLDTPEAKSFFRSLGMCFYSTSYSNSNLT